MCTIGNRLNWLVGACLAVLLAVTLFAAGCTGPAGRAGPSGAPGASTGILSGVITNSATGKPLGGVVVSFAPAVQGAAVTSDASGTFNKELPLGVYTVALHKNNFESAILTVSILAGQTVSQNTALKPLVPVVVNAGQDQTALPGASVTLTASAEPLDGSTISGYKWVQTAGVTAILDKPGSSAVKVTLGGADAYKAGLVKSVQMLDRFMIQPISPDALNLTVTASFEVTVTTTSGSYVSSVNVTADSPYKTATGLSNVPQGVPVMAHGKKQAAYNWILTVPAASKAVLDNPNDQNPVFTPDVTGRYSLIENSSKARIDVYAGTWAGAITGIDAGGQILATNCSGCHNDKVAPDKFTPWKISGHASIFPQNVNTSALYGEGCFACHTVGFDKTVNNGGIDEAADYAAFLSSGILGRPDPTNWNKVISNYPRTARLTNAQCENCHGPNNTPAHPDNALVPFRVSISADVCATCHGDAPRYSKFQQWQSSKHSNYQVASDEAAVENRAATAAHCGRCHSGQGFLAWIKQSDLTLQIQGVKGNATVDELTALGLTVDTVQPQTCATCHDPHNPGTVSGLPTNATVRIQDVTGKLPSGFRAEDVGKGALCIMCHNTRNGPHNDEFPTNLPTNYSSPHTAAQGDVLLGESAYLVDVPQRSPHASIQDTCVTCHMEKTPPPAEFAYAGTGTNHTFAASVKICSSCHSDVFNGEAFQSYAKGQLQALSDAMGSYLMKKLSAQITVKDYTPHAVGTKSYDVKGDAFVISKDNIVSIAPVEIHGQISFLIKLKSPVAVTYSPARETPHTLSLSDVQVQLGDISGDGKTALLPFTDVLVKAGWNYFLIHADGSFGVHNPDFVADVLRASIDALK